MGKRSNFERNTRDFYPTPLEAVEPLIPHLDKWDKYYYEPCCGDGALINALSKYGLKCMRAGDISPQMEGAFSEDARNIKSKNAPLFITNPPWDRSVLHPIIDNLSSQAFTWLLFDADWMHTKQAIPYLKYCWRIVSVGRVKWIPGSSSTGKDNCCWYQFFKPKLDNETKFTPSFYGRN